MIPRVLRPPNGSYFLFGPRGTGKSTWIKNHYPDAFYINLLDTEYVRFYSAKPERLRETVEDLTPLLAFRADYPQSQAFFIYRGKEKIRRKGITCLPLEEFLLNLDPAKSFPYSKST